MDSSKHSLQGNGAHFPIVEIFALLGIFIMLTGICKSLESESDNPRGAPILCEEGFGDNKKIKTRKSVVFYSFEFSWKANKKTKKLKPKCEKLHEQNVFLFDV